MRDNIFQRLYSHHYPLAAACGRYLVQSIKLNVQDVENNIELLDRLIHFEMVSVSDFLHTLGYPDKISYHLAELEMNTIFLQQYC